MSIKIAIQVKLLKNKEITLYNQQLLTGNTRYFLYTFIEVFILKVYRKNLSKKNPVIIDAGSNIGLSALDYKLNYPNAKIICIEPEPQSFKILQHNMSKATCYNIALGNKNGSTTLYYSKTDPGETHSSTFLISPFTKDTITVPCKPLSKITAGYTNIDLLKLDIEGAELEVIKELVTCKEIIKVENLIIEIHDESKVDNFHEILSPTFQTINITRNLNYALDKNIMLYASKN